MCGIAGIITKNKRVDPETLRGMSRILAHRGPDGDGFYIADNGTAGLMHRRLSIIDLSDNASQPMKSQDGRYVITFNGEIYNYVELKEDLVKAGYRFRSTSDTEVLLALFAAKGKDCLQELDGMFAFAIWDTLEENLFIARDRFGEKPLYYSQWGGGFYFASEIKALTGSGVSPAFSEDSVFRYLGSGLLLNPADPGETFYRYIRQLDAAHYMVVSKDRIETIQRYWDLDPVSVDRSIGLEAASERFLDLFTQSVRLRLRSDVPVGSSLSGGIDSSSIVLTANRFTEPNQTQNTFSARFDNFSRDEGAFMEMVIRKGNGITPYYVWPKAEQLLEELSLLAYHQEEPFASGSIYAQFCVMRLAKENHTTVLLDGQGADEQMGGYLHYYAHHLTHLITREPLRFVRERKAYQALQRELVPYRIPRRLPFWLLEHTLLRKEYKFGQDVRAILKRDTTVTGLKTLLRYADRNSMAFSREVRLPFLSHKLVEFVFSLPTDHILHKGWTKYVLRRAMEGNVPDQILWRKEKIGYEPPQNAWMKSLQPEIDAFRNAHNYLDFTGGRKVAGIDGWKWLMLKIFYKQ